MNVVTGQVTPGRPASGQRILRGAVDPGRQVVVRPRALERQVAAGGGDPAPVRRPGSSEYETCKRRQRSQKSLSASVCLRDPDFIRSGRADLDRFWSGALAAYKAVEVCRRLVDAGVHVMPVLTEDAQRLGVGEPDFVTPERYMKAAFDAAMADQRDRARKAGKVAKPKAKKGKKLGPLVVKSSTPSAGSTLPGGGKVDLKLSNWGASVSKRDLFLEMADSLEHGV